MTDPASLRATDGRGPAVGAVFAGLGLLIVSSGLDPVPHLPFGPGVVPAVLGVGFLAAASVLFFSSRTRHPPDAAHPAGRRLLGGALVLGLPLLFAALADPLGVALALPLVMLPLLLWHGRRPLAAVTLSLGVAAALVGLLAGLLRVPLPLGPLGPLASWVL